MSPVTVAACAVILGAAFAAGALLIAQRIPRWAAPCATLAMRGGDAAA